MWVSVVRIRVARVRVRVRVKVRVRVRVRERVRVGFRVRVKGWRACGPLAGGTCAAVGAPTSLLPPGRSAARDSA